MAVYLGGNKVSLHGLIGKKEQEYSLQKQINFIDYDGSILYSYTKAEIESMVDESELPENPTHTGLIAQGWNWTLAQIKTQLIAIPDGDINIGQMYATISGDTEIDVTFYKGRLSPYFSCAVNGEILIDWGDSTTPSTLTGTSLTTRVSIQHIYAFEGDYTITIHIVSGSWAFYGTSSYLFLSSNSNSASFNRVYSNCVHAIRVGNNVSIGYYAFYYCTSLESITIPSSITSIGTYAFDYCCSLKSVTIPKDITYCTSYVVGSCHSLKFISMPSSIEVISSSAFYNCYSLTSITIPSGVTSIGDYAFDNCYSLKSIIIPSGITSISRYTFSSCYSLESITIPSGVTSIGESAFSGCAALTSIIIPNSVTSIGKSAFYSCTALASVTIPSGVVSIESNTFSTCYSLASITIPSDVTSIDTQAFSYCGGVGEFHFLSTIPPVLANTNVFNNISSDCIIYVPLANLATYQSAENWSTYASRMQGE